jgi:hypothetical protein
LERFCVQEKFRQLSKNFGNIKFSEIIHKKNSEISDFNRDVENILFGIEGREKIVGENGVKSNWLHHNCVKSQHNISILEHEDLQSEGFKKLSFTKTLLNPIANSSSGEAFNENICYSTKYGAIND